MRTSSRSITLEISPTRYVHTFPELVLLFQTLTTIGKGLRTCNSLQELSFSSSQSDVFSKVLLNASNLDYLTQLDMQQLKRSDLMVTSLSAFLSRTETLQTLYMSFGDGEADISTVIGALTSSKSIKRLKLGFDPKKENDSLLLFDLISKSRSINHVTLALNNLATDDLYRVFENLEKSDSIVKFGLSIHLVDAAESIDYGRIASSISQCPTLNGVSLTLRSDGASSNLDSNMVNKIFDTCSNLDALNIRGHSLVRESFDEEDLEDLIEMARTFAGSNMTKHTVLPRELFSIMLYEGFKHLNWFDGQLSTVIRALLDRRTLSHVQSDLLPLSRAYLYVRCRDALETIRSENS